MKKYIKKLFRLFGVDVRLVRNLEAIRKFERKERQRQQWSFLDYYTVNTVLDIGANTGQFATMIHEFCPKASIYSFEPLAECFQELEKNIAAMPGARAFPFAVGDKAEKLEMNRSTFTPSSSLRKMTELHKRDWPQSAVNTREKIKVIPLDDAVDDLLLVPDLLVKMDVQGYEDCVIAGGHETLRKARLVIAEINFVELYQGQPFFDDIYCLMRRLGFCFKGVADQHVSRVDGQLMFADVIFENERTLL